MSVVEAPSSSESDPLSFDTFFFIFALVSGDFSLFFPIFFQKEQTLFKLQSSRAENSLICFDILSGEQLLSSLD